jgi:hypothetical protein
MATLLTRPTLARRDAQVPRLRSRLEQILNVPQRVRLRGSLACGLAWEGARVGAPGLGG